MAKKRVNISIDEELDKEWTEVANRLGWRKSAMVEDFLKEALPYLKDLNPKSVIPKSLETMAKKLDEMSKLVKEYEEKKEK